MPTVGTRWRTGVAVLSATVLAALGAAPQAQAADGPPSIVVQDGVTQPVFGYADAIRERVFIDSTFDSDNDGLRDIIAFDIMRPAATAQGLKAPVIMDASPYYSTLGRGNESQLQGRRRRRRRCSTSGRCSTTTTSCRAATRSILRRHGRHQQLHRLPDRQRPTGQPQRQGQVDRLAQRPGHRARNATAAGRHGRLAQRQDRHDRQVLRRHAGQRRPRRPASRA